MMGPAARILPGAMAVDSTSPLSALENLADGASVISINPVSPIKVFHLALPGHHLVRANGVLAESYHPGEHPFLQMPAELYPHFLGLFPHVSSIDEFGPLNHKALIQFGLRQASWRRRSSKTSNGTPGVVLCAADDQ